MAMLGSASCQLLVTLNICSSAFFFIPLIKYLAKKFPVQLSSTRGQTVCDSNDIECGVYLSIQGLFIHFWFIYLFLVYLSILGLFLVSGVCSDWEERDQEQLSYGYSRNERIPSLPTLHLMCKTFLGRDLGSLMSLNPAWLFSALTPVLGMTWGRVLLDFPNIPIPSWPFVMP